MRPRARPASGNLGRGAHRSTPTQEGNHMRPPACDTHSASTSPRGRQHLAVLAAAALCVGLGAANVPAARAADALFCPESGLEYVPVAEVEAFAAGTAVNGLSVTQGTSPDGFTGVYVGFIDNALGKDKDLLLFKLSSPVIDGTGASGLKPAGIWAGMSGSPVYTSDGRLIGAVAYSLNADNLPIAGVTPAEYMKSIGSSAVTVGKRIAVGRTNLKISAAGTKAAGTNLVGSTLSQVRTVKVAGTAGAKQTAFANRTLARTPRSAPISAFLRSGTFAAAGVEAADAVPQPLVPGGTIAALYAGGDAIAGAIGTVTAVCGDSVWAFGHPMVNEGRTAMLMANASTALIVPDGTGMVGSYKQHSQIGAPLGAITEDRAMGIKGTVGAVNPRAFGLTVDVQNSAGTQVASYHADIADPDLGASAVAYLVGTAAAEQLDQYGAGTGEVSWTIGYRRADDTTGSLSNSQIVTDRAWFPDAIGTPPAEDVWAIADTDLEDVAITGVDITLKLLDDDSMLYRASGVQVQATNGTWSSLSGAKLTAGKNYSLRAVYKVVKNGKASGSAYAAPLLVKLSSKARTSGSFAFSAANYVDEACELDEDGNLVCEDWDSDAQYEDFADLVAALDGLQPDNLVTAVLRHKLKKGSTSKAFEWIGPGVVTGAATSTFKVKS